MASSDSVTMDVVTTKVPARMDRLPWSRWHTLVIVSLGFVWVLDGLEVTIKGAVGASLKESIGFSTVQVAGSASIYLLGAISGALFWAYLTDRFGRKKLFIATLLVYLVGVGGTSVAGLAWTDWLFSWTGQPTYWWFAVFRFITGFGIGGEYAAIHSAVDEIVPARVRGWVDVSIAGSYWLGAAVAALLGPFYLDVLIGIENGWRAAFATGALVAFGLLLMRLYVPESPRWLITHGFEDEADATVREIEEKVKNYEDLDALPEVDDDDALQLRQRRSIGFVEIAKTVFVVYPRRALAGFSIMVTQAFLYNAIFFTYGLMLTTFYGVSPATVGFFLIPFAVGNFFGPLVLGRWFDKLGRKVMIPATFWLSGALTILTGFAFAQELFGSAWVLTLAWVVIFFFASAAASAGYLTISETFPLEIRAMAIAFFYALATAAGGIVGPILFGNLITGGRTSVFYGYLFAGGLMLLGGLMHRLFGVEAAKQSLEDVAAPLTVEEAAADEQAHGADGERHGTRGAQPRQAPRRHRPSRAFVGVGGLAATTFQAGVDRSFADELGQLLHALGDGDARSRAQLRAAVHARRWGPGRFGYVLRTAVSEGLVRRAGRDRYVLAGG